MKEQGHEASLMGDWIYSIGYDVDKLGGLISSKDPRVPVDVSGLAADLVLMLMHNMDRVAPSASVSAHLRYAVAQGLLEGAAQAMAMLDPAELRIDNEEIN